MKKFALAAIAAATLPAFAQADVTVYGTIAAGLSSVKSKDTGFQRVTGVDDFSSKIGFKGNEALGSGLKAIWQVETGFDVDGSITGNSSTETGMLANRETYVGLQGEFGKLRIGYLKDLHSDTEATDKLTAPRRDSSSAMYPLYENADLFGTFGDTRMKNSVRFDSNEYAGFSGNLQYGAGENQAAGGMKKDEQWAARLAYKNSGFFGAWLYAAKLNTAGSKNSAINRLEGGYDANNLYLAATYQQVDVYADAWAQKEGKYKLAGVASSSISNSGNNHLESSSWALAAGYTLGQLTPWLQYSKRNSAKIDGVRASDSGAEQWGLGLDYALSKQTLARAGYGQIKQQQNAQKALGWSENKASDAWVMIKHSF